MKTTINQKISGEGNSVVGMVQNNFGDATGVQTVVTSGEVAFIGEITKPIKAVVTSRIFADGKIIAKQKITITANSLSEIEENAGLITDDLFNRTIDSDTHVEIIED